MMIIMVLPLALLPMIGAVSCSVPTGSSSARANNRLSSGTHFARQDSAGNGGVLLQIWLVSTAPRRLPATRLRTIVSCQKRRGVILNRATQPRPPINVCFTPKATLSLRACEITLRANSGPSSRLSELGISVGDDTGASEAVGQSSIYTSAAGSSTSRSRP